MKTYTLITTPGKPDSIYCKRCKLTSHNQNDVDNLFCGKCGTHAPKQIEKLSEEHSKFYTNMGYGMPVKINGELVALGPFLFTVGIMCGLDEHGYKHRFCYHSEGEAMIGLLQWIGNDEMEPEGYIVKK